MTQNNAPPKKNGIWHFISTFSMLVGIAIVFLSLLPLGNSYSLTGRELLPLAVGFELQLIGIILILLGETKS